MRTLRPLATTSLALALIGAAACGRTDVERLARGDTPRTSPGEAPRPEPTDSDCGRRVLRGAFRRASPLAVPRWGHTATLLADGTVLVAGGRAGPDTSEIYDPGTDRWRTIAGLQRRREGHTATRLDDGRVLLIGADTTGEIYHPDVEAWLPFDAPVPWRVGHTATLLARGRVLIAGGQDSSGMPAPDNFVVDVERGRVDPAGALSVPRWRTVAFPLPDGAVLIAGGRSGDLQVLRSTEIVDPVTGGVTDGPPMLAERELHATAQLEDGRILVAGGALASAITAEILDPRALRWSAAPPMLDPVRSLHTLTSVCGGYVMAIGGWQNVLSQAVEILDAGAVAWRAGPPVEGERSPLGHTSTLLPNGDILVVGSDPGLDPSQETVFRFSPATP